jgi:hypothetical protein
MADDQNEDSDFPSAPGLLPYAHHVGSALINPIDKGKVKGRAMSAMVQQTDRQFAQLKEQIDLLAVQARKLQRRVEISERIYQADMNFEPVHGTIYHLYERAAGQAVLSMIGPDEWRNRPGFAAHVASVQLLADHTWEIVHDNGFIDPAATEVQD